MPSRDEVVRLASEEGVYTSLVLDANVCLDLARLAKGNPDEHNKPAQRLILDVAYSGADVLPGFGMTELSLNRSSWLIDAAKLSSLNENISAAIDSAPGRVAQRGDATAPCIETAVGDSFRALVPILKVFYACFSKMSLLARRGLHRDQALENVKDYVAWMVNDLDCVSGLALQVAFAVFGGDTLARKLIGIGKPTTDPSRIWSGAWDAFYAYHLYRLALHGTEGERHYPIFVTRDRAAFALFSRSEFRGGIRFAADDTSLLVGITSDYPHYAEDQDDVRKMVYEALLSRIQAIGNSERKTEAHLDQILAQLEHEWAGST